MATWPQKSVHWAWSRAGQPDWHPSAELQKQGCFAQKGCACHCECQQRRLLTLLHPPEIYLPLICVSYPLEVKPGAIDPLSSSLARSNHLYVTPEMSTTGRRA